MCESELKLRSLISDYHTGDYIPIRSWQEDLPKNIKLEKSSKGIKTRGEHREIKIKNLICSEKTIKRDWKFNWAPNDLKLENGFLWGKVPEDKLGVFHFSDNNRPFFTVCSKKVELKDRIVQGLGLLEGEMLRSKNGKSGQYLSFSNMKPELVNLAVGSLNQLGIPLERMRVQPIANTNVDNVNEQEIIDYWTDKTSFSEKHFVSLYKDSRYKTEAKYASINLKVYDKIMRNILEDLINHVKTSKDKKQITEFLKGLFAAEGSVNLCPQNKANYISLGVKDPELRNQYREMLQKIEIRPGGNIDPVTDKEAKKNGWARGTGGFFMIQGIKNFRKFLQYELLTLYPKKQLLFLIGLKNTPSLDKNSKKDVCKRLDKLKSQHPKVYNSIQERIHSLTDRDKEVLSILEKLEKADRSQIADQLDITPSSASRRMRSLYQKDKVERHKQGRKIIWTPYQD